MLTAEPKSRAEGESHATGGGVTETSPPSVLLTVANELERCRGRRQAPRGCDVGLGSRSDTHENIPAPNCGEHRCGSSAKKTRGAPRENTA